MNNSIEWLLDRIVPVRNAMKPPEFAMLSMLAIQRKTVIEVGAYCGALTKLFCTYAQRVFAIDHFVGDSSIGHLDPAVARAEFEANNRQSLDAGRLTLLAMDSADGAAELCRRGVEADLVWIDAAHDYEHVRRDVEAYKPLLRPDGLLCGHDACDQFPGVIRAVDELCPGALWYPTSFWLWWPDMPDFSTEGAA